MQHWAVLSVHGARFGQFSLEMLGVGTETLVFNSLIGRRKPHDLYDSRDRVNVSRNFSGLFIGTEWCCGAAWHYGRPRGRISR